MHSPYYYVLFIVDGVLNDFATGWLFYVWFLSNDSYHVQTYDLWFLSVRTICRTILWSNIRLMMFIISQYYTHALSNVAITFIEWFSWRYQVVQILTLFDIRFSLWQRYVYNVFWNKRSETYVNVALGIGRTLHYLHMTATKRESIVNRHNRHFI